MPVKRQAPLTLRLADEMRERLKAQAKENGQSLNACIVDLLERGLSIGTIQQPGDIGTTVRRPVAVAGPGERPKTLGKKRAKRTAMCEHRRQPEEFCSRCDT